MCSVDVFWRPRVALDFLSSNTAEMLNLVHVHTVQRNKEVRTLQLPVASRLDIRIQPGVWNHPSLPPSRDAMALRSRCLVRPAGMAPVGLFHFGVGHRAFGET